MALIKYHGKDHEDPTLNNFHKIKENLEKHKLVGEFYEHKDDSLKTMHKANDLESYLKNLDIDTSNEDVFHKHYIADEKNRPTSYHQEFLHHLSNNKVQLKTYKREDKSSHKIPLLVVYEEDNQHSNKYIRNNFLKAKVYRLNDADLQKNYKNDDEIQKFIANIDKSYKPIKEEDTSTKDNNQTKTYQINPNEQKKLNDNYKIQDNYGIKKAA